MSDILHGKIIITESYYDGELSSSKQEKVVNLFTTKETLLKDVIESMDVLSKGETKKLDINICVDKMGRYRIIKRWVVQ